MKQLNLFDLDDFQEENEGELVKLDQHENQQPDYEIFEEVESPASVKNDVKPIFSMNDQVKIILISEDIDSETHHYRKYYEPHLIGKVGEITDILISSNGKKSYEVTIYGEKSIFEEAELMWMG